MTLTHYLTSTGPRVNSPTQVLTPCAAIPANSGASGSRGDYRATVSLRYDDETATRTYRLDMTPDEARQMAARLLDCATHAEEAVESLNAGGKTP